MEKRKGKNKNVTVKNSNINTNLPIHLCQNSNIISYQIKNLQKSYFNLPFYYYNRYRLCRKYNRGLMPDLPQHTFIYSVVCYLTYVVLHYKHHISVGSLSSYVLIVPLIT